jgi:methionyl-tRNA formyltransferase
VRTVFLGTSRFAAAVLRGLAGEDGAAAPHRPALVLTRPDRPAGRGRKLGTPPVAETARALGIELAQPERVNDDDARALIASAAPDAVIVCAFGALVKEPLLSDFQMLNVHPSLLPRWRGAAPIERAIMAGDEHTGVSIMRLTAGLDSGPVCLVGREPISTEDTYGSLAARLERSGVRLLVDALDTLQRGASLAFVEQDKAHVTYAEKIGSADRLLDPGRSAVELERVVRALHPHVGARVALSDGTLMGVHRAALADPGPPSGESGGSGEGGTSGDGGGSGEGLYASDGRLLLACASGTLELLVIQPPGKRAMDAAAFLRGHGLPGA